MEPSLPDVKSTLQHWDATAEVTDNLWPRVRRVVIGGDKKLY